MAGILDFAKRLLDRLDCSYGVIHKNRCLLLIFAISAVVALGLYKLYKRIKAGPGIDNTVKYLISTSARHVNSAVSLRNSRPLEAFEHAIYGAAMANVAKDLVDDKTAFSKELDVDVFAYLDYTNQVVGQIKQSLKH